MVDTFWLKQTEDKPLFPGLLWSRPENKAHRGKLLVIGGSSSGFSAVAESYSAALKAGIGSCKVLLPKSLEKLVANFFPEAEFAPGNSSGSFASSALAEFLDLAGWADGVILAGDFSKNSETAIMIEKFVGDYRQPVTLTGDSLDFFLSTPQTLLDRANTLLAPDFAQVQKLAMPYGIALTSKLDLIQLVERLHGFSIITSTAILLKAKGQVIIAKSGQISTTINNNAAGEASLATSAAVWWLQNPDKPFEALSTAAIS